jgi:hypothetical protein
VELRRERPESLNGVTVLEEVLKLEAGELTVQFGSKRPRGGWIDGAAALEGIWHTEAIDLARAIAHVDKVLPSPARYIRSA